MEHASELIDPRFENAFSLLSSRVPSLTDSIVDSAYIAAETARSNLSFEHAAALASDPVFKKSLNIEASLARKSTNYQKLSEMLEFIPNRLVHLARIFRRYPAVLENKTIFGLYLRLLKSRPLKENEIAEIAKLSRGHELLKNVINNDSHAKTSDLIMQHFVKSNTESHYLKGLVDSTGINLNGITHAQAAFLALIRSDPNFQPTKPMFERLISGGLTPQVMRFLSDLPITSNRASEELGLIMVNILAEKRDRGVGNLLANYILRSQGIHKPRIQSQLLDLYINGIHDDRLLKLTLDNVFRLGANRDSAFQLKLATLLTIPTVAEDASEMVSELRFEPEIHSELLKILPSLPPKLQKVLGQAIAQSNPQGRKGQDIQQLYGLKFTESGLVIDQTLDPANVLSPGKVIRAKRDCSDVLKERIRSNR